MKQLVIIVLLTFAIKVQAQQIIKADLVATGLTCSMCSNAIYKQLKSISNVDSVTVDLNTHQYTIYLNKANTLSANDFKIKVEKAGFFVGVLTLYFNVNAIEISDGKQVGNYVFIDTKQTVLNGIVKAQVMDKGFITAKEYKKNQKEHSKYKTYSNETDNIYHLKLM